MKKHIVVVDDESSIRELLGEFLTLSGYRVTTAQSALEAQRAVEREAPDLIVSDLQLEDSDGLDLIAELKTTVPDTPVILLTGVHFDPKVAKEVLSKKVSCYLQKTSPLSKILEEVRRLIGS